ncbi:MAG: O-antigen ligase family protein [Candidatus Krumholzibacteriota bacterium]|nr:O-antigen ligase family protein [Candidatus Krumholzibacteriota bacterium]
MKLALYGDPVDIKRLALLLLSSLAAAAAALIFLPSGLIGLALRVLLILPAALILFDNPRWICYLLIFILFSNVDVFAPFRLYRILLVFLFVSLLVSVVRGRRLVLHNRIFIYLVGAFLLLAFQSMAFARDLVSALDGMIRLIKFLFGVLLMMQFIRDRKELLNLFIVVTLAMLACDFLPLWIPPPELYADLAFFWDLGVLRYEGYVFDANMFAFHQIFYIPLVLFLMARYPRPRLLRPLLFAVIGGMVFVTIISFSRGGFISLLFLFITLLLVERKNKRVLAIGTALIIIGAIAAPAIYWERISSLFSSESGGLQDYAIMTRIETMKVALILGAKNPLTGVGMGNYIYRASYYVPFANIVHNALLQVFSELGVIAVALYLYIIAFDFKLIFGLMGRRDDAEAAQMGRVLFVQLVAVLINSMFIPVAYHQVTFFTLSLPVLANYAYAKKSPAIVVDREK